MNGNISRAYRPTGRSPRDRRREDRLRTGLIAGIILVAMAAVLFLTLIIIELADRPGKDPSDDPGIEQPSGAFELAEIEVPSKSVHAGDLILINSTYPYVFPETSPVVLPVINNRTVHGKSEKGNNIYSYYTQNGEAKCAKLEEKTLTLFQRWTDDFYRATQNSDLFIFDEDGYRTKEDQEKLVQKKPTQYAAAGATEHHTGKATDLYVYTGKISGNIDDPGFISIFSWIYDNAYKYGFIHRYPAEKESITGVAYEPYHFRQVGYAHAFYMYKNGYCLEEYLDLITNGHTAESPLEFKADDGNTYMVYYQKADEGDITKLSVPAQLAYSISGDNRGGFVITVTANEE